MDNNMVLILIMVGLIIMSAYFSATETAFTSINKIKMKNLAQKGNKKAEKALLLLEDYDKLLSTILIGNNIVNIASASISTVVFVAYFQDMGVTLSTVVMTIVVLIFGEISPKSLAKEAPESFAMLSTPLLTIFMRILAPLNLFFFWWKKLLSRVFKIKNDRGITEEEIITMVEEAEHEGEIEAHESELICSAIEFDNLTVGDVLMPRVEVVAVDIKQDMDKIYDVFEQTKYTRLPVYEDNIDNIIGVLHQKDFISGKNKGLSISEMVSEGQFVPKSMKLSTLLKLLQNSKVHMAIVIDEFGGTLGIVTLEDILEELVGEIWDEHDDIIKDFSKVAENKYIVRGNARADKLLEFLNIDVEVEANTVNGFVTRLFGYIPEEGESVNFNGIDIVITKKDECKIDEVIVEIAT